MVLVPVMPHLGGDKSYGQAGGILSTIKPGLGINGSGLSFMQGTSMASPHVAGLAGLVFAAGQMQGIDASTVESIIYSTTHAFGKSRDEDNSCVGEKSCGHGIIDAKQALEATLAQYDVLINAPSIKTIEWVQGHCTSGQVMANSQSLSLSSGEWALVRNRCISLKSILPHLKHDGLHQPVARYGKVEYRLKTAFSQCQRIGVDGLGCYR